MQPSCVLLARLRVAFVYSFALLAASPLLLLRPLLAQPPQELVREGDSLFVARRYGEALAAYEKARTEAPDDVGVLLRVARSREALWDPESKDPANTKLLATAANEYREVLAKDPEDREALDRFVMAKDNLGKRGEAYSYLRERAAKRPTDAWTLAWLSMLCRADRKVEEQESWLRKLVAVSPNDAEAYYTLGVLAWERSFNDPGDKMEVGKRRRILDAGIVDLDRAIAIDPDYFEAMLYKNLLFREQAKVEADPSKRSSQMAKADEWQKKALETRKRVMEGKGAASRPKTPLTGPAPPPPPPPKKPATQGGAR